MDNSANNYRLAVDFSQVQSIPANPRQRLRYFQAFKKLIKYEKEKIKDWHRSGAGGREIIQAHTSLIDEVIRHVLLSMTQLKVYAETNVLNDFPSSQWGAMVGENSIRFQILTCCFSFPEKLSPSQKILLRIRYR